MPTGARWRAPRRRGRTASRRSSIVTPNHLHAPVATAFLEAGIDVICDKPLSTTLAEAEALVALAEAKRRRFLVTLNNTGYAMVRQAREMVAAGELGTLVAVHASYIQDWLTRPIDAEGQKQAEWRTDPARAGQSAVLADIGVHAFNLACFVSGLRGRGGRRRPLHRRPGPAARRQRPRAGALVGRAARHHRRQPDLARPLQRPDRAGLRRQGRARMDAAAGRRSCASRATARRRAR